MTPGSGNKNIKGDIQTKNWILEVKQTCKDTMTLDYSWLTKLMYEGYDTNKDVCIVLFFGLRGYPYYFKPVLGFPSSDPATKELKESDLPHFIHTEFGWWEKDEWESLSELE